MATLTCGFLHWRPELSCSLASKSVISTIRQCAGPSSMHMRGSSYVRPRAGRRLTSLHRLQNARQLASVAFAQTNRDPIAHAFTTLFEDMDHEHNGFCWIQSLQYAFRTENQYLPCWQVTLKRLRSTNSPFEGNPCRICVLRERFGCCGQSRLFRVLLGIEPRFMRALDRPRWVLHPELPGAHLRPLGPSLTAVA
jgi:hypothetical protein